MPDVSPASAAGRDGRVYIGPPVRTFDLGQWAHGAGLLVLLAQISANESGQTVSAPGPRLAAGIGSCRRAFFRS